MSFLTTPWLTTALDSSIKTIVLVSVVLVLIRLLRLRNSDLKHRVWAGVTLGMLAMPLASICLPALWSPAIELTLEESSSETSTTSAAIQAPRVDPADADRVSAIPGGPFGRGFDDRAAHQSTALSPGDPARAAPTFAALATPDRVPARGEAIPTVWVQASRLLSRWSPWLFVIWVVGATVLLGRLLLGCWAAHCVVRGSQPLSSDDFAAIGASPPRSMVELHGGTVEVYESEGLRVPVTVGFARPKVILPTTWITWSTAKIESVLAHEAAHAQRFDSALMIVAGLNRACYWFHPIAWWLKRQLADLAETACDDAAISENGDRTTYAKHLLEVASLVSSADGRLQPVGVSMARRTNVEARIDTILDFGRPLTHRVSRPVALLVTALLLSAVGMIAMVKPEAQAAGTPPLVAQQQVGEEQNDDGNSRPAGGSEQPKPKVMKPATTDGQPIGTDRPFAGLSLPDQFAGRAVDEAGQPIEGAKVFTPVVRQWPPSSMDDVSMKQVATTGADGRFAGDFPETGLPGNRGGRQLSIHKPGLALGSVVVTSNQQDSNVTLTTESVVSGRILNAEGSPIANAQITVTMLGRLKAGKTFDDFLTAWKKEQGIATMQTLDLTHGFFRMLTAESAADGRFKINGLAEDSIASLTVDAEHHATTSLYVFNRPGFDPASLTDGESDPFASRTDRTAQIVKSPNFQLVCEPGLTVEGVVTDDQGNPVENVRVTAAGRAPHMTKTDAAGRYQLSGLSRGQAALLSFDMAGREERLMSRTMPLKVDPTIERATLDVRLYRGVVISGQVVDADTGKGVMSHVRFAPLAGNEFAQQPGFDAYKRSRVTTGTDPDGSYRIVASPGPGVILVQTLALPGPDGQRARYRQATVTEAEAKQIGITGKGRDRRFTTTGNSIEFVRSQNALRYVNNPPETDVDGIDLAVSKGRSLEIQLVDRSGKPVEGGFASGVSEDWPLTTEVVGDRFQVVGLGPNRPRWVLVLHRQRKLAGRIKLQGDEQSPIKLTMGPAATIRGRALDPAGQPIAGLRIRTNYFTEVASELYRFYDRDLNLAETDVDGRFEISHVMPIAKFNLDAEWNGATVRAQARPERVSSLKLDPKQSVRRLAAPRGGVTDLGDLLFGEPFGKTLPWPTAESTPTR